MTDFRYALLLALCAWGSVMRLRLVFTSFMLAVGCFVACSKDAPAPSSELAGCAKDTDCKDSRVCVNGMCADAQGGPDAAGTEAEAEASADVGSDAADAFASNAPDHDSGDAAANGSDVSAADSQPAPRPCSETCTTGCCDTNGTCQVGTSNTVCGWYGRACSDCTLSTSYPPDYVCLPIGEPGSFEYLCEHAPSGCGAGNVTCTSGCCSNIDGTCQAGTSDTQCGFAGNGCANCTSSNYPSGYHCLLVRDGPNVELPACVAGDQ